MQAVSDHTRGFSLTLIGVLLLTPDALMFRLVNTDYWTITSLRGCLMPVGLFLILAAYYRRRVFTVLLGVGAAGIVVALLTLCTSMAFSAALTYTTVTKTLVVLACTPMFTALFSWFFLKENLALPAWAAIFGCLLGIAIVVSEHGTQSANSGSLAGDLAALLAAISMGAMFTFLRHHKAVNMLPAFGLGWLLMGLLTLPFAQPFSLDATQIQAALVMGLVLLPVSMGLIVIGPRYIPAPEVSLLMLLETVLGPFWVWLVLNEEPSLRSLVGGTIVVTSIALYSLWRLVWAD